MLIRMAARRVRLSEVVLCLSVLLEFSACGPRSGSNYTTSGQNLGNVPLRTIAAAESRVSVAGGDALIKQYEARDLSDRRQEQITLEGGFITVSFMNPNHFMNSNVTPDRYLMNIWIKPWLHDKKGVPVSENMIKKIEYQTGELFYASGRSSDEVCFLFNSIFWNRNPVDPWGQGDTNVRGGVCLPQSHPLAENLQQHMLDLLMRMRFS